VHLEHSAVTPNLNRKQVQDIVAKFQCELARNGKVKKSEFYPLRKNGGCYPNCKGGIDNRIQREKLMKIGQVKLQLHAGPQFKESSVLLSAI